jgi:dGTPase
MAFLLEAADDISYRIIDFEDGFRLGHVPYRETASKLLSILNPTEKREANQRLKAFSENKEKVEYLRARALNALIYQVAEVFLDSEREILSGAFDAELVSKIRSASALAAIRASSREKVYSVREVVEIEAAGFEVLGGLLDYIVPAVLDGRLGKKSASKGNAKYFELLPVRTRTACNRSGVIDYERVLLATDFVSGMTDSYAVALFKMLKGISLPNS